MEHEKRGQEAGLKDPIRYLSLSCVGRFLRLDKGRLIREVRLGRLRPDATTDSGGILFLPVRLHAISEQLKTRHRFKK